MSDLVKDEAVELAARNILRAAGRKWVDMDEEWQADVRRYREMCAKFPDYEKGGSELTDAFRSARAALAALTPCKVPFQHDADSCVCQPSQLDLDAARFNRSAGERKSIGHQIGRAAQFVFVTLISFAVLFSAGAWGLARTERAYQSAQRI